MNLTEANEILHSAGAEVVLEAEVFDRFAQMISDDPALMWPMVLDGDEIIYATNGEIGVDGDMLPYTKFRRASP
jgi:hypothetical protein